MTFDQLDLSDNILMALSEMNFKECTPIQEQTIPIILEGHDLIACAQTGTGKTAAFLLPVIDMIYNDGYPTDAINCIVMSPTRELAQQIDRQMEGFAYHVPVESLPVYGGTGGEDFGRQQRGLRKGVDIVIATPGRLLDHIKMGYVDLSQVSFFILDEADRMLDMGFYDDIMRIARQLPTERQTLMFSATMPAKTRKLAKEILRNPRRVDIAVSRPTDKIDQNVYLCQQGAKPALLLHILRNHCSKRVIVFAASKMAVKDLTRELRRRGIKAAEMHSDLDQNQREDALLGFRAGKIDVIVATDILARGIDIDDIAMVVNYDVPREVEDYVHRIGRTARADRDGIAVTIVSERDRQPLRRIEQFLGYEIKRNELPDELASMAPAKEEQPRNYRQHGERRRDDRRGGRRGSGNQKGRGNAKAPANKDIHAQAVHNGNNNHNRRTNRSNKPSQKQ